MSSLITSHGAAAFATAVAISGTFIIIAFSRQKQLLPAAQFTALDEARNLISLPPPPHCARLRPCISSEERKRERASGYKKKKNRRVHFAEEVVEFQLDGEHDKFSSKKEEKEEEERRVVVPRRMPANRLSLYHGILQDRMQRMTCSY